MTFEELQKANSTIKMKPIKGKNYAEVKDRIIAFRQLFPEGFIITNIVSHDEDSVLMTAQVGFYDEKGEPRTLGTGTAFEFKAKNRNINATSMFENCETSAVGRALGMLGLGIESAVASYDEMRRVENVNTTPQPVEDEDRKSAGEEFLGICKNNNLISSYVAKAYKLNGKPTAEQFQKASEHLKSLIADNAIPADWRKK